MTFQHKSDQITAVKNLKLDSGRITRIMRYPCPDEPEPEPPCEEMPPHTVVRVVLNPAPGSNINVEVRLPDAEEWNGRYLGLGNGGPAGNIHPSTFVDALNKKFAAATTDMGTAPDPASGIGNREVWKDFGFRATHLMTVAAKTIIAAYYGKDPIYSYFRGSSTGGQQALQEAQRYPEDYDGIVSRVPGHCRTPLHAYFLWNHQILQKCPFTEEQEKNVIAAAHEYMAGRELPQTAGLLISDPRCTPEDIEAIIALARKNDSTLTDQHAAALRKLFDGPKHTVTGERIFGGIPPGSTFEPARNNLYLFNWVFGADRDYMAIDFDRDIDTYTAELGPYLNAENPDLRPFEKRGGKLIMLSGTADSCVPYHATLDYYERVIELSGSLEFVRSFFRFYIIPGMEHGLGPVINQLPDFLDLLVDWRENGVVPEMIRGQQIIDEKTILDIPIHPYPEKTTWNEKDGFGKQVGPRGGVERIAERFLPAAGI